MTEDRFAIPAELGSRKGNDTCLMARALSFRIVPDSICTEEVGII